MTKRVDPAAVAEEAGDTKLEDVFKTGQGSLVSGVQENSGPWVAKRNRGPSAGLKIECRMIPMGRDKQPRPVVVEWRRRKGRV